MYFNVSLFYGIAWSLWWYGSWIYNSLCNQCLSPLTLRVRIPLRRDVLDTTLCDKVCQWLAAGRCFSLVSFTNKTNHHDILKYCWKWRYTINHSCWPNSSAFVRYILTNLYYLSLIFVFHCNIFFFLLFPLKIQCKNQWKIAKTTYM